jgi:hypothetical protein
MTDYSAMKSYQEKKSLHYFTFFPISEGPIKAVIRHLPPDVPAEDISSSLEDLGCKVTSVRQTTATRRAPNGKTQVKPLPLFIVALKRNTKSQDIFKLYSLNYIIVKVALYTSQNCLT